MKSIFLYSSQKNLNLKKIWNVLFLRAYLGGHANNSHCLAAAINTILCALFSIAGRRDTEERLKEFLAVSNHQTPK